MLKRISAFVIFIILIVHVPFAIGGNAKKEAKDKLESVYYVKPNDCKEFKKAIKDGNVEEMKLFVDAEVKFSHHLLGDSIISGFKSGSWDLFNALLEHPNQMTGYGCTIDERPYGDGNHMPPNYFISIFDQYIKNLKSECPRQDQFVNAYFDRINSWFDNYSQNPDMALSNSLFRKKWPHREASYTFCEGTLKKYLSKYPQSANLYLNELARIIEGCYNKSSMCPMGDAFWNSDNQEYIAKSMEYLKSENVKQCERGKLEYCKAIKDYTDNIEANISRAKALYDEKQLAQLKEKEKSAEYNTDTPKGIMHAYCATQRAIEISNTMIDRQNKIGGTVGVVDMGTLYQAGSMKVSAKEYLDYLTNEYVKKTGKQPNRGACR